MFCLSVGQGNMFVFLLSYGVRSSDEIFLFLFFLLSFFLFIYFFFAGGGTKNKIIRKSKRYDT